MLFFRWKLIILSTSEGSGTGLSPGILTTKSALFSEDASQYLLIKSFSGPLDILTFQFLANSANWSSDCLSGIVKTSSSIFLHLYQSF